MLNSFIPRTLFSRIQLRQPVMERQIARKFYSSLKTTRCAHVVTAASSSSVPSDKRQLKNLADIPGPSGIYGWPYIGSAFLFHPFTRFRTDQINLFFEDLHRKYGKIVKFRKGKHWTLFLYDPTLIEVAMRHEGRYPERPPMPLLEVYARRSKTPPGLSQLKGKEWYDVRKPIQDCAMKPQVVAEYLPAQSQVADDLVSNILLERYQTDGISKLLFRYTVESTSLVCFNTRLGFLDNKGSALTPEQVSLMSRASQFMTLVSESFYTFPWFRLYPDKLYKAFARIYDDVRHTGRRYVDEIYTELCERKARGALDPQEPNLLLSLLNDPSLPKETCLNLMTGFFTVATENVAKSLCILLWLLAKNVDKQERLYQEITSQFGEGEIQASVIAHMPYLKACVKEMFRVAFPTPVGSVRVLGEDVDLAGYHIPKGTEVHYCHNALCHSSEYFDCPESYLPERWLRDDKDHSKNHLQAFVVMPFGFGARNCLGRRFAEQQINLAVVKLLQTFKITLPDPKEELDVVYNITATKRTPLELNFEKRTN